MIYSIGQLPGKGETIEELEKACPELAIKRKEFSYADLVHSPIWGITDSSSIQNLPNHTAPIITQKGKTFVEKYLRESEAETKAAVEAGLKEAGYDPSKAGLVLTAYHNLSHVAPF